MIYIVLLFIGLIAGLLGGLLGIGGGIFTVPALLFVFYLFDFPESYTIHVAIGTSLGIMIFTAISSTRAHFLKKGIQWNFLRYYSPGVICGGVLGAFIADILPSRQLVVCFSLYIFCFGLYFLVTALKKYKLHLVKKTVKALNPKLTVAVGFVTGTFSSILGVGGAPITIPFLTAHRVELKHAISTSACVTLFVGIVGSLSYLFFGMNEEILNGHFGYLYLPGMLIAGGASVISAPYGARLAYLLPTRVLRAIFGLFLIIVSWILMMPN